MFIFLLILSSILHHLLQNAGKHLNEWEHWHQIDRKNRKLPVAFSAGTLLKEN